LGEPFDTLIESYVDEIFYINCKHICINKEVSVNAILKTIIKVYCSYANYLYNSFILT